jgi:hypothetical protein
MVTRRNSIHRRRIVDWPAVRCGNHIVTWSVITWRGAGGSASVTMLAKSSARCPPTMGSAPGVMTASDRAREDDLNGWQQLQGKSPWPTNKKPKPK